MKKTPGRSSPPSGSRRACLCPNNTYSIHCCDGSLQAQGIGRITRVPVVETDGFIYQNGDNMITQGSDRLIKNG